MNPGWTKVLIEDERVKLYDPDARSEIYRRAREYFVDDEITKLSSIWGPVRVGPVIQPIYDYLDDNGVLHRVQVNFIFNVSSVRKSDGIDFYVRIEIPVEFKGHWEAILGYFSICQAQMESYAGCSCRPSHPCDVHSTPMPIADEAILRA